MPLFMHSESPVSEPFTSGMTRIGATPLFCAAKAMAVWSAKAARVQSEGWPGGPCSSSITGSCGRLRARNAGGDPVVGRAGLGPKVRVLDVAALRLAMVGQLAGLPHFIADGGALGVGVVG